VRGRANGGPGLLTIRRRQTHETGGFAGGSARGVPGKHWACGWRNAAQLFDERKSTALSVAASVEARRGGWAFLGPAIGGKRRSYLRPIYDALYGPENFADRGTVRGRCKPGEIEKSRRWFMRAGDLNKRRHIISGRSANNHRDGQMKDVGPRLGEKQPHDH